MLAEMQQEGMDVREPPCSSGRNDGKVLRVGCALLPKKVSRYLTSSMRKVARSSGVELVLLDHTKPLLDQGDYDAIVHKLRPNKEWERNLQEYVKARPDVKVIDSLAGIRTVHNRATMLLPLRERPEGITIQRPYNRNFNGGYTRYRVQSPTQVEIHEGTSLVEAEAALQRAGLRPPLLVKPLWTDGREGSHGLAVLHDMAALSKVLQGGMGAALQPPLVVQQFVEHGGVLFKVYVLGSRTVVSLRPSLGNSYLGKEARRAGVLSLPRISCKSHYHRRCSGGGASAGALEGEGPLSTSAPADYNMMQLAAAASAAAGGGGGVGIRVGDSRDGGSGGADWRSGLGGFETVGGAEPPQHPATPPDWVTSALASTLRSKLGLQLFNFDMICPEEQAVPCERLYYVVDINYFPGVDKIPDFERIFVDFLTATCEGREEIGSSRNGAMAAAATAATTTATQGQGQAEVRPEESAGAPGA